ncbi:bifunctional metallophosphatase/5'-nucleotidase [Trujillonella endophytica]|uniref:5'-nucleotidase n=1 Tax=Trujillonella endophytica TaxID=673521 RepID=A0A1H8TJB0_9ACTN|nr:bifunctional metallophosphatase/5'-nucleotidase [Trujillella endophytica]SEO90644.1 5'-nucleotidase [Trujillella endophytica]
MPRTRLTVTAVAALTSAAVVGFPAPAGAHAGDRDPGRPGVAVQLVAVNDFHGRISLTSGGDSELVTAPGPDGVFGEDAAGVSDDVVTEVGGSAAVAATVQRLQQDFTRSSRGPAASFFVGAGDLVSASPFESSVYRDEPTIEVLDAMGLDVSSVGNHEFDRGTRELLRISGATDGTFGDDVGACDGVTVGVDGCFGDGEHAFDGADFPYLAANVVSRDSGEPLLPPYQVFTTPAHQRIALIGVVTDTTPTIVAPAGVADVEFLDEATAINSYVPELRAQGIEAIGVLIHEGGEAEGPAALDPNGCDALTGPIVGINDAVDPAVDLIVSAHTHQAYNCLLPVPDGEPRLVTQAGYYGRLVTDIRLTLDRDTGDVDRTATYAATNVPVTRDVLDPRVQAIVDHWNARAAEAGDVVVGTVSGPLLRARDASGAVVRTDESVLGTFVANAQLAGARAVPELGDPVVAFMNPGGLRTDIDAGDITYRELFDVQPFSNTVNTLTLTGADIDAVLEQQFGTADRPGTLLLSTSDGFRYEYDPARPAGDRVFACSITIDGVVVDPAGTYRVAANSFLAGGGDSFTAFEAGTDPVTGPVDVDTAVDHVAATTPLTPPAGDHAIPVTTPTVAGC